MTVSSEQLALPRSPAVDLDGVARRTTSGAGAAGLTKAGLDRLLAVLLLALLGLPMLVVGFAVRGSSAGPVFYRQVRYGRSGVPFQMWKFRTMVVGADLMARPPNDADGLLYKVRDDARVTAVGRFLRRWSVDELPQLFNVLRGEMSLVGPRPLPVAPADYPAHARDRLLVKPGITGLWQVSGRSDLSWDRCLALDLHYVHQWSLRLDLRILGRTLRAVVGRAGAY